MLCPKCKKKWMRIESFKETKDRITYFWTCACGYKKNTYEEK